MSVGLAMLVGAGGLGLGQASASPLANTSGEIAQSSQVELVQAKKWKYDRNRHGERKAKRNRTHRFFFDGFWYRQPFWSFRVAPLYVNRLSCWEARRIIDRRFDRVRVIECNGRIYTFAALNKRGKHVRVSVNSRTGDFWRS
jgi:hypothetical protein